MKTPTYLVRSTTAALLLGLSLTACGGDDEASGDDPTASSNAPSSESSSVPADDDSSEGDDSDASGELPSEDELAAVLLTAADLPEGFTAQPEDDDSEDDDTFAGTCLADVGEFSDALGFEPDVESEVNLTAGGDAGQTFVGSQVEGYADASQVGPAFADFTDTLQSCTSVQTTDADGVEYDLQIAYDDSVDLPGAEDQLRVEMTGTIAAGSESYDLTFRFVVALLDRFISIVGVNAVGDDATATVGSTDDLAALQATRVTDAFA